MTAPAIIIPASQIEEWVAGYRELASHGLRARQNLAFTVAMTRDDRERVARTVALVRALTEAATEPAPATAPAPTHCHYGTLGCRDRSDAPHECARATRKEPTPRCVACREPRDYGSSLCARCEGERDRAREGDHARVRDYGDARL